MDPRSRSGVFTVVMIQRKTTFKNKRPGYAFRAFGCEEKKQLGLPAVVSPISAWFLALAPHQLFA
jgi:hypothetical protein